MNRQGFAPGWRIRCPKCGHTEDAASRGIIRIKAASWKKRVLMRCSKCHRLWFLILERT